MTSQKYKINVPRIVYQVIEKEAILIDKKMGIYYSLQNTAAAIWGWIEEGLSAGEMLPFFKSAFPGENIGRIENLLISFLAELKKNDLILEKTDCEPPLSSKPSPARNGCPLEGPFQGPVLEKFTDMQEYLLVDPIHDVDEMGWPHKKEKTDNPS